MCISVILFLLSLQISIFLPFQVKAKLKLLHLRYFHRTIFEDIVAKSRRYERRCEKD